VTFADVAAAFEARGARRQHDGTYRGPCPAHGGTNRTSLSLREGPDGKPRLHCFARGCDWRDILTALGFDVTPGAFPPPARRPSPARRFRHRLESWEATNHLRAVRERDVLVLRAEWLRTYLLGGHGTPAELDAARRELAEAHDRLAWLDHVLEVLSERPQLERADLFVDLSGGRI
jgi:hypothetical protein